MPEASARRSGRPEEFRGRALAEIINLRTARKARARADKDAAAAANRRSFGQTKDEKRVAREAQARLDQILDGAKRDPD
jgi:hypothetical protein